MENNRFTAHRLAEEAYNFIFCSLGCLAVLSILLLPTIAVGCLIIAIVHFVFGL